MKMSVRTGLAAAIVALALLVGASAVTLAAPSSTKKASTNGHSTSGKSASGKASTTRHHSSHKNAVVSHRLHGQQGIAPERATEIQQALIRAHYLSGDPTGQWDNETQTAMTKYQADQGWQTRLTPDSRALIKLGLGPDHSDAINATTGSHFNTIKPGATQEPAGLVAASGASQ